MSLCVSTDEEIISGASYMIPLYKPCKWIFSPDTKEQRLKTVVIFCTTGVVSIS